MDGPSSFHPFPEHPFGGKSLEKEKKRLALLSQKFPEGGEDAPEEILGNWVMKCLAIYSEMGLGYALEKSSSGGKECAHSKKFFKVAKRVMPIVSWAAIEELCLEPEDFGDINHVRYLARYY